MRTANNAALQMIILAEGAKACAALRKSEALRFLKVMNFHFAHRSSNPLTTATQCGV
jgi:hypothetical protein